MIERHDYLNTPIAERPESAGMLGKPQSTDPDHGKEQTAESFTLRLHTFHPT